MYVYIAPVKERVCGDPDLQAGSFARRESREKKSDKLAARVERKERRREQAGNLGLTVLRVIPFCSYLSPADLFLIE